MMRFVTRWLTVARAVGAGLGSTTAAVIGFTYLVMLQAGCTTSWQFRESEPRLPNPPGLLSQPPTPPGGIFQPDGVSAGSADPHGQLAAWGGSTLAVMVRGGGEVAQAAFDAPFGVAMLQRGGPATPPRPPPRCRPLR